MASSNQSMEFIPHAGTSMTTYNVLERRGRIRWLVREKPLGPADNGWRVFSHIDTSEYLANRENWVVVDFNTLCSLEPVVIGVWNMPVGSDLQVVDDGQRIRLVDTPTGREIPLEEQFNPAAPPPPGGWPQYAGYTDPADDFIDQFRKIFSAGYTELPGPWNEALVCMFMTAPGDVRYRVLVDGAEISSWPAGATRDRLDEAIGSWYEGTYRSSFKGSLFGAVRVTMKPAEMRFKPYSDSPTSDGASFWQDVFFGGDAGVLHGELSHVFSRS